MAAAQALATAQATQVAQNLQTNRFEALFTVLAENSHTDAKSWAHLAIALTRAGASWTNLVTINTTGPWYKVLCADPDMLEQMRQLFDAASTHSCFGFALEPIFVQVMRDALGHVFANDTAEQRAAGAIVRKMMVGSMNMSAGAARALIDSLCVAGGGRAQDRHFNEVHDRILFLYVGVHTYALATTYCPTDRSAVPDERWRALFSCVFRIAQSVCNAADMDQLKAAYVTLYNALMAERALWFVLNAASFVPGARVQYAGPVPPNAASGRSGRGGAGTKRVTATQPVAATVVAPVAMTTTPTVTQNGKQRTPRVPCSKCVAAGQIDSVARSHLPEHCVAVNANNTPRNKAEINAALKTKNAAAAAAKK